MKRLAMGFVAGIISGVIISATVNTTANELIEKAEFNDVKVSYNGDILDLNQNLISVQTQGSDNAVNYMPVRAVLEGLGYTVNWNGGENMIEVSDSTVSARSSNSSVDNDEWISVDDILAIYGYDIADGRTGAGVYLNKLDKEPLFFSEIGKEDNIVRIIGEPRNFKFNKADLIAIGIKLN